MVEKFWSEPVEGTAMKVSFLKLKRLKHVLRDFNKRCYGDLSEKVQDKKKELEAAQLELYTRNSRSTIKVLITKSGGRVESQAELTEEIVGYFKRSMGTSDTAVVVPSVGLLQELCQCPLTSDYQEVIGSRIERREFRRWLEGIAGRKSLSPRCAMKIDLQKAYNFLNWDFIFATLEALGFPLLFIHWIGSGVTQPWYSISFNGGLLNSSKSDVFSSGISDAEVQHIQQVTRRRIKLEGVRKLEQSKYFSTFVVCNDASRIIMGGMDSVIGWQRESQWAVKKFKGKTLLTSILKLAWNAHIY
ncbi:hypothetical protein PVK06_015702 [Gossypium arboreum]|uniref:Reverse transcriptase domain-containing protein n=1 Tax=Gossypium arboreum TaxID=29729 RepID=A0ABR0PYQ6_GOSAR|nr:hypothetical protein PVK06_015702 [Gossypium arboreum]